MKLKQIKKAILIWGIVSQDGINQLKNEKELVIVPEQRPYLIGLLQNAPLLKKEDLDFVYCTDNMLGYLFYQDKIKKTVIFYKELTPKGIIGVSGSLYVGLLSHLHKVPIKILPEGKATSNFKDFSAKTLLGKSFVLEKEYFVVEPKEELVSYSVLR